MSNKIEFQTKDNFGDVQISEVSFLFESLFKNFPLHITSEDWPYFFNLNSFLS